MILGNLPDYPLNPTSDLLRLPRLYAIVDPSQSPGSSELQVAEALLSAGVRLIQLRDKHAPSGELYQTARLLSDCVHNAGGIFIVNDRADVARVVGSDGVHVGQDDLPVESARVVVGPSMLIGYSTHVLEQVKEADRSSADYIAFGPIFATSSKANPDPVVGLEGLREARRATSKPLVAIGGITLDNARAVIDAGADSVAIIRGLIAVPDVRRRAEEFLAQIEG